MTNLEVDVPGRVTQPPAPGAESAGPPLTDLVQELKRAAEGLESLYRQARFEARERVQTVRAQDDTDGNGDALLELLSVPQGATGYLMSLVLELSGVTPAAPMTSATLWHAIYAASGPGISVSAQVVAQGALLDCSPLTPAADAQLPYVYTYGDRYGAPTLVGPQTFYAVVDAATAARVVSARASILIVQPEP